MNKYSVLMSIYNKENPQYLVEAIESMIHQTIPPTEIVIVEDGPLSSELDSVLSNYIVEYPNLIKLVKSKKNVGLGRALCLGITHCSNDLIARMDTDDISNLVRCEKQLEVFSKNNELTICGSNINEFIVKKKDTVSRRVVPEKNYEIHKYLKKRCPFNHMTVMFKKQDIIDAGNYTDWFFNEDYYLWLRLHECSCIFYNIQEPLVDVRVGAMMYKRRGGFLYFRSEYNIQKYMLDKKIINFMEFIINISIRFIGQILMPSSVRGYAFKKLARKQ